MGARRFATLLLLGLVLTAGCASESGRPTQPYRIGIAPSHVADPPDELLASANGWEQVAAQTDLYKYYGVQLMGPPGWEWTSHFDPPALVDLAAAQDFDIGCEFGDFHLGDGRVPDASNIAFQQIDPIFESGGEVVSLHLDGPVRRLLAGAQDHPNAMPLDAVAALLVDFWQAIHAKYPEMRIGLITNFPNWDYTSEFVGYNGHHTDDSGVTYAEALEAVYTALTEAGETLDFVEVDCPHNYYRETATRNNDAVLDNAGKFIALQQWCEARDVAFHLIINAEPRGAGAQGFHDWTCDYVRRLHEDGIEPDLFIVQSWYKEPEQHLRETEANTFMNTARDAMGLIHELYSPTAQDPE